MIWRVVYMEKQIFLWLLFCFVIFILCFQQNQTPILIYHLLQHIPSHFLDFLHHTWRPRHQEVVLIPDISKVVMSGMTHQPEYAAPNPVPASTGWTIWLREIYTD